MAKIRPCPAVLCLITAALVAVADGYTNHTVGGGGGWFFNATTNTTAANYTTWASNQTFSLGDYLIFNSNTNQTVVQTYSKVVYDNCSMDDSSGNDTFQYYGGSSQLGVAIVIPVPLTIEGTQYYFSDAQDGEQCQHGMAFEINVSHGAGLPPSLNRPPPPPYIPPPMPGGEGDSPIVTSSTNPSHGARLSACANFFAGVVMAFVLVSFME